MIHPYFAAYLTLSGYGWINQFSFTPSNIGFSSIYNLFPSIIWINNAPLPVTLSITANSAYNNFNVNITNCNSNQITIPSGTEINVLVFGV